MSAPQPVSWWCERAWLGGAPVDGVRVEAAGDGTIASVERAERADRPAPGDRPLRGVVLPGFADAHSHAFHRALRGRGADVSGSFWSWRERMYAVADRLDPDTLLELATAAYAEAALAGVTCVGEFAYVHHAPGGRPYDDPNAMGEALREAARRAGVRLTLLDTCYLAGGVGQPVRGVQLRFADADAEAWAVRAAQVRPDATTRTGAAIHSVRAVPADALRSVASAFPDAPLHVHVSEQRAEDEACLAAYGCTPTSLLADHGALSPRTTVVHATHVSEADVGLLRGAGGSACLCPTTERELADGLGPFGPLADAGVRICVGSDSHAVTDLLEEARGVELHERLRTGRSRFGPADLVDALTAGGHAALGWPEAGRIEAGAPCDLVAVRLDSVRTAGVDPAAVVLAATACDVDTVVVGGRTVVDGGQHVLGDVAARLTAAVARLTA